MTAGSADLPLEDKAARLFWVTVYGSAPDAPHPANRAAYGVDTPAEVVRAHRPGGVVLFAWAGNTGHPDQVAQLTGGLRAAAAGQDCPLGVAIDEEGGRVARLGSPATAFPSARAVAAAGDEALALRRWSDAGAELAALGVTVNLAPVADLGHPPNPVLGDRTFADDPATVAAHAALAVRGLGEAGVAAVAKHFPGHGATTVDSHAALPVVDLTREELEPHLDAFRRLLATQPPAGIMAAHLLVRALDDQRPATLSPAVLTGLLRGDLGYTGAILTDSLAMAGIRTEADDAEVAVRALAAGADVLLTPPGLAAAAAAVCRAVRAGRIAEERLDDALARAAPLVHPRSSPTSPAASSTRLVVGHPDHHARAAEIARRAVRVTARPSAALPVPPGSLLVVGGAGSGARALADALRRAGRPATLFERAAEDPTAPRLAAAGQARPDPPAPAAGGPSAKPGAPDPATPDPASPDQATPQPTAPEPAWLEAAGRGSTVVLVRRAPELDAEAQDRVLAPLARAHGRAVLVETGAGHASWPGDLGLGVVATHGACQTAMEAAAHVLVGPRPHA